MPKETNIIVPGTAEFEGVKIQTEKGQWVFARPEGEPVAIDTYSIWSPKHWAEINERLIRGEIGAFFYFGNFGVGQLFTMPDFQKPGDDQGDRMFQIKQRSREHNFVSSLHPEDQIRLIDVDRLHSNFKHLRSATKRMEAYAAAQINVFPARRNNMLDSALTRADGTVAFFWIRGHWGYEGIINTGRKMYKRGIFGGSSLSIHGKDPCYDEVELYQKIQANPAWLKYINFIVFDELAETEQIGRSQPMVSFSGETAQMIRYGSYSVEKIMERTGYHIEVPETAIPASNIPSMPYTPEMNEECDKRVEAVLARAARLWQHREGLGLGPSLSLKLPQQP